MILEKDHIAKCAAMTKIHLTGDEIALYDKELKDLFRWVEELSEVDTSAVQENSAKRAAYLRPDQPITDAARADQLVKEFNEQEGRCAKVKKVL